MKVERGMFIDTHCHLDGEEFDEDRVEVMQRAREAGCKAIFLPAIDLPSSQRIVKLAQQYPDFLYPMIGLHPEEVRADWHEQLGSIRSLCQLSLQLERAGGEALFINQYLFAVLDVETLLELRIEN